MRNEDTFVSSLSEEELYNYLESIQEHYSKKFEKRVKKEVTKHE